MTLFRSAIPRDIHLLPHGVHPRVLPTLLAMAAAAGICNFPTAALPVALPELHDQLDASIDELQWAITGYTLAASAFLIAAGRIADIFGRRRILLAGTGLFVIGSVLAALAPTALVVIAGMVIAGLGFAAIIPSSLSIVVNAYPPERRGVPIGVWGAATVLFQGVGPLIGGALTGAVGWRGIFWFDAVIAAAVAVTVLWATAESRDPAAERRIDTVGLALAAAALFTLSLAVTEAPSWGVDAPQTLILLGASVVFGILFVWVERRSPAPLVNFAFFRQRNFTGATAVLFVVNFALIVAMFFLPLMLEELLDYSPTETGALLLPLIGSMVITLPLGGPIGERIGPLPPLALGLATLAVGLLLLSGVDRGSTYADLWPPMLLVGAGTGLAMTPMNVAAMNAIRTRESGAAGGVFTTLSGIGIGFGVAISGAIFNARQLSETQDLAATGGVELSKQKATELDGLLAGAPGAERTLSSFSNSAQSTVQDAVTDAFALALASAFRVGAVVAIGGLLLALLLIRSRPPADVVAAEREGGTG
jgi:EmrB/QacA subfamily drug resistance transporter